jgi:hypothetical protein
MSDPQPDRKVFMDIPTLTDEVRMHEARSQARYESLMSHMTEKKMTEPVHIKNIFEPNPNHMAGVLPYLGAGGFGGAGAGAGAGLGAGLLGGILGGALLGNRNGLFGNNNEGSANWVTPTQLQTGLDSVTSQIQSNSIMQTLGDIKAAVPLAEGQVQLALAGAQNDITNQLNASTTALMQGQFAINKNVSDTTAQIIATEVATQNAVTTAANSINLAVATLGTQGLQNTFALSQTITNDGEKTRALLTSQFESNLQRQLAVAEAALIEQRAIGRSAATEVNVTQTVNQAQAQAQAQQQQQQQAILLNGIWSRLEGMQQAIATNSNMIIGNTGATTTGPQTANPVNVRT